MTEERRIIEGEVGPPAHAEPKAQAVDVYRPSANPFDADPQQFAVQVAQRGENYQHLIAWLIEHMIPGEDMVQVHFVKRSQCDAGGPPNCAPSTRPHHWSDPALSKKGAEKICGLLGLATRFLGMDDFRRMALKGQVIEDVIVDCEIYGANGQAMSQGTGAASRSAFDGDLNRAMKAAAKRAHIDAVKRIAGLSGIETEIKRRMPPVDPEAAAKPRAPSTGAARNRFDTGATLTHCPIGKHKDKPWREIPSDWLEWAVREMADKPDIHRAAAGELAKRKGTAPAAGTGSTHTQPPPGHDREPGQDDEPDPCACSTPGSTFCPIHGEVLNDEIPF